MSEETDVFEVIDNSASWGRCLSVLSAASRMAVDLEADSLYAYREQICLIQISTDEHHFIIDPLAGLDLSKLGALFTSATVEKVFHAADYDLILLKSLYGWKVKNLFDTMWAGRVLGFTKMGLAWFLETLYDIKLSKKCQKADWSYRPLSHEKLVYAHNDTCHLLRMRDDLEQRLLDEGHIDEAREIFDDLCDCDIPDRTFNPEGFWRLTGVRALSPRAKAVLKALFAYRDDEARRRNVPPFKVVNNQTLMQIAVEAGKWDGNAPKSITSIPGVPDKLVSRLNPQLLRAVKAGLHAPIPVYPTVRRDCSPGYWQRYETLMTWRKETARERGVESDVIVSRKALEEIAEQNPSSPEELERIQSLGPWRRNCYGAAILRALAQ